MSQQLYLSGFPLFGQGQVTGSARYLWMNKRRGDLCVCACVCGCMHTHTCVRGEVHSYIPSSHSNLSLGGRSGGQGNRKRERKMVESFDFLLDFLQDSHLLYKVNQPRCITQLNIMLRQLKDREHAILEEVWNTNLQQCYRACLYLALIVFPLSLKMQLFKKLTKISWNLTFTTYWQKNYNSV